MPTGRKGVNKSQGSILDSFKKVNSCEDSVQLEVIKTQATLPSADVLESLNQLFKKFKSSLKKNLKRSSNALLYDAQNECQETGNRIILFFKGLLAQGLYPDNGKVEMLVQVLNEWCKHECDSLALQSYLVLRRMLGEHPCVVQVEAQYLLVDADCWDPFKTVYKGADVLDFLVSCIQLVRDIQSGKTYVYRNLGQVLLFQYLVHLFQYDAEQRIQVVLKNIKEYRNQCLRLLKNSYIYRAIQLSIGANQDFIALLQLLIQIVSLSNECHQNDEYNNDVPSIKSIVQTCNEFLKFIVNFLSLCENKGLFYKHNCRVNFRMQIDVALINQVLANDVLQNADTLQLVLSCFEMKGRVRFWGLFLCYSLLKDKPNARTSKAISQAYYYYNNPTELESSFTMQSMDILSYISDNAGFKFVMNKMFKKGCNIGESVCQLLMDVVYSALEEADLEVYNEVMQKLDLIILQMEQFTSKIDRKIIEQIGDCKKQVGEMLVDVQ